MTAYSKIVTTPAPVAVQVDRNQVLNNTGGYVFALDTLAQLERFLILGSLGGTYYATPEQHTRNSMTALVAALESDPLSAVNLIASVSVHGRSFSNATCIFALAAAAVHPKARYFAWAVLKDVCRTGSQMLEFMASYTDLGGKSNSSMRRAVSDWYNDPNVDNVAFQVIKYRNRHDWTHRDVLRQAHTKPTTAAHDALFRYITKGEIISDAPPLAGLHEQLKAEKNLKKVCAIVREKRVPWEMVPTELLAKADVWDALLPHMPPHALLRNLGRLTANGLLAQNSDGTRNVCAKLRDAQWLKRARLHPLSMLQAWNVYGRGSGIKGSLTWKVVIPLMTALEEAFIASFQLVDKLDKRVMWCQDVSGSMAVSEIKRMAMSCMEAGAVLATAFANSCGDDFFVIGFSSRIIPLNITRRSSFNQAYSEIEKMTYGSTDAGAAITYALRGKIPVDMFVMNTDSEVNDGDHVHEILEKYRQKMGVDAKLAVMGMTATPFTLADPSDAGMLDMVGLDSNAFNLLQAFANGFKGSGVQDDDADGD